MGKFVVEAHTGALYVKLPEYGKSTGPAKQVLLSMLWQGEYRGPYVVFDLDSSGAIIGIEINADDDEESENS